MHPVQENDINMCNIFVATPKDNDMEKKFVSKRSWNEQCETSMFVHKQGTEKTKKTDNTHYINDAVVLHYMDAICYQLYSYHVRRLDTSRLQCYCNPFC